MSCIVTITGASGTGKSTLESMLCGLHAMHKAVSVTTREPRPGEKDGSDYYFVSKEEFLSLSNNGGLIESTEFCGSYYGVSAEETLKDCPVVAVVEPHGLEQISDYCKQNDIVHVAVFIAGELPELIDRYLSRHSKQGMTPEEVEKARVRLEKVIKEEVHWVPKILSSSQYENTLVFDLFCKENENEVIKKIVRKVEELTYDKG